MLQTHCVPDLHGFKDLLAGYQTIALIANSETVRIESIAAALPENTLFVFFTGCAKVLREPFERDAILCHRLVADGKRFLKSQKHFDSAHGFFSSNLKAETGILADKRRSDSVRPPSPRNSPAIPLVIDFDYTFDSFYPAGRMPTTGFALALWLMETLPNTKVYLCGFTGVPGTEFNMYTEHDWTFEQTVLQLFVKKGRILQLQENETALSQNWLSNIANRFPEFDHGDIALVASQVIGNRLTGAERRVAKMWDQTKWRRKLKAYFKRLRRK